MALVMTESRICFGLEFYDDLAEAAKRAQTVKAAGHTYNGGYFHGMPCGREQRFDFVKDGKPLYAVSV